MTYLKTENKMVVNDCGKIKLFDMNWKHLQTLEYGNFQSLGCFCADKSDRLFIENFPIGKILLFDSNLNYLSDFPHSESKEPSSMQVDIESTPMVLYVSYSNHNKISVYDIQTGKCEHSIEIDSPREMAISRENIFVLSLTGFNKKRFTCEFQKLKFGSNCIFLLNKYDYCVLKKIQIENWLFPNGLLLDKYLNLITTAFQIDCNNLISSNRFLFVIDSNGQLIHNVELQCIQNGNIQFSPDKLINWTSREIKMIDFF